VSAGSGHSLAIGSDGRVYAWGRNLDGQLGNGSSTAHSTPVALSLPGGSVPTEISAGIDHSVAMIAGGEAYGWGYNDYGQLGNGGTTERDTPTPVGGYTSQTQLVASPGASRLGRPVTLTATVIGGSPTGTVQFKDGDALLGDAQPLVGGSASLTVSTLTLGRHALGAVYSGDSLSVPSTGLGTHAVQRPARIASGGNYTLEIIDGKLYGWGYNSSGQLGDGTTTNHASRGQVLLPAGVVPVAVAAGDAHSLALAADGSLYAWGDNHYGQLGDGSTVNRSTPVRVVLPAGVTAVAMAAGYDHSLALGSDGQLYGWGSNASGQLGDYTTVNRRTPVRARVPAGVTPGLLAAGFESSLMIATDGQIYAWGNNSVGQLGDGSTTPRSAPVLVGLPAGITAIELAARDLHALAIGSDGQVYAWGYNAEGQLGSGDVAQAKTIF
jgi:alpha-tubulin suppressor-like RCC1 family protein